MLPAVPAIMDIGMCISRRGLLANERILLLGPSACERRASELFDDEVNRYLRLVSELGQVVYHFAIGYPIPDPRLEA
jgi:hypothetical protein